MLRFAPSPTGNLHIGNVRIAVLNYLYAQKKQLDFFLRIDDTDTERSEEKYVNSIIDDLRWLGINFSKVIKQFTNTSKLAFKAGYDGVEIHMAHGYLLHEFCSPVTNKRIDKYGLNSKNFKLPVDIIKSIKKNLPKKKIIGARITATDHLSNGIKISDSISLVNKLKKNGLNYVCVSSGGIISKTNLKFYKGFRLKLANSIKKKCRIITRTSGMFDDFNTIKRAVKDYRIDFIALGRILIKDKYFLIKNKNFKINHEIKQYKYCFN